MRATLAHHDALEWGTTPLTWLASSVVHVKVAEIRASIVEDIPVSPECCASVVNCCEKCLPNARMKRCQLLRRQTVCRFERVKSSEKQGLISVDVAKPRHDGLIEQY